MRSALTYVAGLVFIALTGLLVFLAAFAAAGENRDPGDETASRVLGVGLFGLAVATCAASTLGTRSTAIVVLLVHAFLAVVVVGIADEGAPFLVAALIVESAGLAAVLLARDTS